MVEAWKTSGWNVVLKGNCYIIVVLILGLSTEHSFKGGSKNLEKQCLLVIFMAWSQDGNTAHDPYIYNFAGVVSCFKFIERWTCGGLQSRAIELLFKCFASGLFSYRRIVLKSRERVFVWKQVTHRDLHNPYFCCHTSFNWNWKHILLIFQFETSHLNQLLAFFSLHGFLVI